MSLAKKPSRLPRRRGAFTLVELLVVIGIIALLISILLPALNRARSQANSVKCMANLRSQGQALMMYLNQWKAYPGQASFGGGATVAFAVWPTRLRGMLNGDQGIFNCPSQESGFEWPRTAGGSGANRATAFHSRWSYDLGERLLSVSGPDAVPFSYGYNDWGSYNVSGNHGLGADMDGMGYNTPYIKIGKVRKGAEMIAIADNTCDSSWDFNIDPNDPTEAPGKIHNGGANVLFCDGHVTWYTQQDVCLFDVKAWNQRKAFVPLPPGDRRSNIARMWNNDNLP